MAKKTAKANRKAVKARPPATELSMTQSSSCVVPPGYALVPITAPGILYCDGFNVQTHPFPANPAGQRLIYTTQGLAWENV